MTFQFADSMPLYSSVDMRGLLRGYVAPNPVGGLLVVLNSGILWREVTWSCRLLVGRFSSIPRSPSTYMILFPLPCSTSLTCFHTPPARPSLNLKSPTMHHNGILWHVITIICVEKFSDLFSMICFEFILIKPKSTLFLNLISWISFVHRIMLPVIFQGFSCPSISPWCSSQWYLQQMSICYS